MHKLRFILLFASILFSQTRAFPELNDRFFSVYLIENWNTSNGLPSNSLMDIYQTSDSFIWITSFNGLIKYDGVEFKVFNKNNLPNLNTNGFRHIFEDHNNVKWFGTVGAGILQLKNDTFRLYTPENDEFTARKAIVDDQSNEVWIATNNHGVYNLVDSVYKKVDWPQFNGVIINDIAQCHSKVIWFATEGNGVAAYKDGKFYKFDQGLMSNEIKTLAISPSNDIWIGTVNGLSKIKNSKITNYPQFKNVEINGIYIEEDRYLWIAAKQGLYIFDTQTNKVITTKEYQGINITGLTSIIKDAEDSYWITSEASGLIRLRQGKFMNFTRLDGLTTDRINSVFELNKTTFLVGTDDGRVHQIKNERVSPFKLKNEFPDVRIKQISMDKSGDLWISSDAGLIHKHGNYEKLYTMEHGFPTNQVRFHYEDSRGWKWIGTRNGGVIRLKQNGEKTVFNMANGLSSNFIFSAIEDDSGRLIITTRDGGINRIDLDDNIAIFYGEKGMAGNSIFNAYKDYDGNILLCSNAGLMRFKDEKFKVLTANNGLPLESIFDINQDEEGNYWISSSLGVLFIRKYFLIDFFDGKIDRIDVKIYDDNDGMFNKECTGATKFFKDSNGRMWFPTFGGVSRIDPNNIYLNRVPPALVINSITADDTPIKINEISEIDPDISRLTVRFSALSFISPSRVTVEYQLKGLDDKWINAGLKRQADFINLPSGAYQFNLRASNNDGIANNEIKTIAFIVGRHFYNTIWFYAFSVITLLVLLRLIYYWRVRKIKNKNIALENIIEQQKITELALRESEEKFRTLVTNSSVVMFSLNKNNEYTMSEGKGLDKLNLRPGEIVGMSIYDLYNSDEDVVKQYERAKKGETFFSVTKIGAYSFETFYAPIIIDKVVEGVVGVATDVSDRLRATEQIRFSANEMNIINKVIIAGYQIRDMYEMLRYIIEMISQLMNFRSCALYLTDSNLNANCVHAINLPKDFIDERYEIRLNKRNLKTLSNGSSEYLTLTADQGEYHLFPIMWVDQIVGIILIMNHAVNEQMLKMLGSVSKQLGIVITNKKTSEERNMLIHELEQKNEEMERFTYTVSHDLKSPLFTIRGYIGVLEDLLPDKVSEEVKKYFAYIKTGVDRMQELLNDLLEISRVGRIEPIFQEVDIDQVVEEAIERVSGQIKAGQIEIEKSTIQTKVYGEKQRLIEVFQNLIDNAIKFMGDQKQPRIKIGADKSQNSMIYYVADNGVGIEEAYRDKVFGLFERLSSDGNGTGIGLAIVKRIIEQHKGKIWVDSEGKNKGSKFNFTINTN